jgi:hypothetical protein
MPASLEELERRVIALERAQNENTTTLKWMAGTLGEIKGAVDDHTERLQRVETEVQKVGRDVQGLRRDMPGIVMDAMSARD